jgi:hypothetical protein
MLADIECSLADGRMVVLQFNNVTDAESCLQRLYRLSAISKE